MIIVISMVLGMITILSLAAIGGSISERAGITNLSIEGYMTIGAISYALLSGSAKYIDNQYNQIWIMLISGLISMLFAYIYSVVTIRFKASQTIAGIAINTLALAISFYLIHSEANPQGSGDKIQIQSSLLSFGSNNEDIGWIFNIVLLMGIPLIGIMFILLNKTRLGIKIKAVGEQPHAAASLAINVTRTQTIAVLISGLICGIAGAMFIQQKGNYFRGSTDGIGFLAVSLVIFGQWRPTYILGGAMLFGVLYGLVEQKELVGFLKSVEYKELLSIVPYALSLFVLIFTQRSSSVPKYLGIPYVNAGR